jgi:MoaA/NifB/PqqE/SkfB family radical SAM enzyme
LTCDFCYGPVPAVDPVDLRDRIATRISESTADAVTFCGGEPLLVKKLPSYADRQRAAGKKVIVNTNGELLRRRFADFSRLPFDVVGVSIDGADERLHRCMRGAAADFVETVAAARWLKERHSEVRLKIGTVLSAVNASDVERLAVLVRDLAPDVWRIYQYSPWGPQNLGLSRHSISDADYRDAVCRAVAVATPVEVAWSTTATTRGCLIVDSYGQVLVADDGGYRTVGNCVQERLEKIWEGLSERPVIATNKRWIGQL